VPHRKPPSKEESVPKTTASIQPPSSLISPTAKASVGGLSFSEFIELIGRIALIGMDQPNYQVIFPTPFSKILAILTVWGVADLKKLEEVHIIRTEEAN
jgi:hypothetical protein